MLYLLAESGSTLTIDAVWLLMAFGAVATFFSVPIAAMWKWQRDREERWAKRLEDHANKLDDVRKVTLETLIEQGKALAVVLEQYPLRTSPPSSSDEAPHGP